MYLVVICLHFFHEAVGLAHQSCHENPNNIFSQPKSLSSSTFQATRMKKMVDISFTQKSLISQSANSVRSASTGLVPKIRKDEFASSKDSCSCPNLIEPEINSILQVNESNMESIGDRSLLERIFTSNIFLGASIAVIFVLIGSFNIISPSSSSLRMSATPILSSAAGYSLPAQSKAAETIKLMFQSYNPLSVSTQPVSSRNIAINALQNGVSVAKDFFTKEVYPMLWKSFKQMIRMEAYRRFWSFIYKTISPSLKIFLEKTPFHLDIDWIKRGIRKLFEKKIQMNIDWIFSSIFGNLSYR